MNITFFLSGILLLILSVVFIAIVAYLQGKRIPLLLALPFIAGFLPIGYIDRHLIELPTILVRGPYLIVLLSALMVLISTKNLGMAIPIKVIFVYSLILVLGLFSSLVNNTYLPDLFWVQRGYFVLLSFYIILRIFRHRPALNDLMAIIVWMSVANAAIAYFQRIVVVGVLGLGSGDMVSGLFTADGQFLFFQLAGLIIVVSYWFYGIQLIAIPNAYVLTIILFSVAIGNNKASWGFVLAIFLVIAMQVGAKVFWRNFRKVIWMVLLGGISYSIFDAIYVSFYNKQHTSNIGIAGYVANPEFIQYYLFGSDLEGDSKFSKGGSLKRGAAVVFAYDHIKDQSSTLLLGRGGGSTQEKGLSGERSYFSARYPGYKVGRTTFSLNLAEGGVLAVCLVFIFAISVLAGSKRGYTPQYVLIRRTIAFLIIGFVAYESLFDEISHMMLIAILSASFPRLTEA